MFNHDIENLYFADIYQFGEIAYNGVVLKREVLYKGKIKTLYRRVINKNGVCSFMIYKENESFHGDYVSNLVPLNKYFDDSGKLKLLPYLINKSEAIHVKNMIKKI